MANKQNSRRLAAVVLVLKFAAFFKAQCVRKVQRNIPQAGDFGRYVKRA